MNYRITPLVLLLSLSACSPNDSAPAPKLLKSQRELLDQAKTIEATQQQMSEEQRKTIEQQTQ